MLALKIKLKDQFCETEILKNQVKIHKGTCINDVRRFLTPSPPLTSNFYLLMSDFFGVILDPPSSPPKIGHHLCTFPYVVFICQPCLSSLIFFVHCIALKQLKKSKSWEPFWSYCQSSKNGPNALNWQCSLAGHSNF